MAEVKSVRFTKDQERAIEDMVDRDIADNSSEAHRMLVSAGMREYGYTNGEHADTFLKLLVNRMGWLSGMAGAAGLAFTLTYPVSARLPSFALIVFSLVCFGLYALLENYEPKVTKGLLGLVGKGDSA